VETIFAVSRERRLPVIWNNNAQVAVEGVLSGIGADWELLGRESGEAAAAILAGAPPSSLPRALHRDQVAWINLDAAERLGLDLGEDALSYFDRRVSDGSRETCM
jgi:ABC-type uncharacterized transport system substrate-binding protein